MIPANRPGIALEDPCTANGDLSSVGERCGCVGGYGYGKYGTAVCVMRNKSHPMHGAFCQNTTAKGVVYDIEGVSCCPNPDDVQGCGQCTAYAPIMPFGRNNRITFPEANGEIITTGNIDALVISAVNLEGLELNGFLNFGWHDPAGGDKPTSDAENNGFYRDPAKNKWFTLIDFDPKTTKMTGGLTLVGGVYVCVLFVCVGVYSD
jgi:hypothetical protein